MDYIPPIGKTGNAPYIDGDPAQDIEGDAVSAKAWEHPMREIVQVINDAGLTPDSNNLTQLSAAIMALISASSLSPHLLADHGYHFFPGGLILQWGSLAINLSSANYTASVVFPVAFPTACLHLFTGHFSNGDSSANADNFRSACYAKSPTGASFAYECINSQSPGSTLPWLAIGY